MEMNPFAPTVVPLFSGPPGPIFIAAPRRATYCYVTLTKEATAWRVAAIVEVSKRVKEAGKFVMSPGKSIVKNSWNVMKIPPELGPLGWIQIPDTQHVSQFSSHSEPALLPGAGVMHFQQP